MLNRSAAATSMFLSLPHRHGFKPNQTIFMLGASQNRVKRAGRVSSPHVSHRSKLDSQCFPRSSWSACLLIWFFLLAAHVCFAQTQEKPAPSEAQLDSDVNTLAFYEGQNVSSIQVAGRPGFTAALYSQLFSQHVGQPFSQEKVEKTAAAIKASGHFDRVQTQIEPESNGVEILFVVQPADYFGIFEFPGAQRFPYSQLIQAANYPIQEAFNQAEVESDAQALVNFYRQEGFFQAVAEPHIDADPSHAVANVRFQTTLGARARFGPITIEGAPNGDEASLQHRLTTLPARLRGAAIRQGKTYHHTTLTRADEYLRKLLEKQGYLGAQVKLSGAEYQAGTNRAEIHFSINPGAPTRVQIDGVHLWRWTRNSLLPMYQGIGVDEESVEEGRQALSSYFQAKGFFDVKVDSQFKKDAGRDLVLYKITREKKHKVTSVGIKGNTTLLSSQLGPNLKVTRKHFFSPGKFSDQLVQASIKNLKAVYQSEGFSSVQVTADVTRPAGNVHVVFRVIEGPRDIVNSLSIQGADTFSQAQFAPDGLKVVAGQPYSQAHVQADRASILANYLKAGYLMSGLRETATQVSKSEPHRINVVYRIHEGPRVMTGDVITLGREKTRQRLIDSDVRAIKPGQPLAESALLSAGSRLYDHTGVFDWSEVDPKQPITTQHQDDVLIKVHEAKRNNFTYGFGFEVIDRGGSIPSGTVALPNLPPIGLPSNFTTSQTTFYGPRGTIQYTRNNLFGKGESLSFTGFAGRLDQRVAIYYIDPNLRWSAWKATTSLSIESNEENPIYSSGEAQGTIQIQRPLDAAGKNIFFLQYGFSQVDLTRVLIPSLVPTQDQHVRLSTLSANITRDTRDNPLDEHKGVLQSLQVDFNPSKLGSSVDFAKLTGQAALYREKFRHIVWAGSIRVGLAEPFNNSYVPLSQAFFTGGGNSLRGFPLDGAGPQRQVDVCSSGSSTNCQKIQVSAGGNEMLIVNAEARIPLPIKKGLSLVPFYDGGNVFPNVGFHDFTSLYSNNIGIGLRYATPVGPIRVDLGRNLNPIAGVNATQYFVGIGQAF
jgi:outer membrane protein assembly factor BamA